MKAPEIKNPLTKNETDKINICAVLSEFMYLDTQDAKYTGKTLGELVFKDVEFIRNANPRYLAAIQDAVKQNPVLQETKLVSQSNVDDKDFKKWAPHSGVGKDLIISNVFELPSGEICVAYRGTGDGKWIDNGEGLAQENTVMQEAAARYFDYIYNKFSNKEGEKRDFYVTGHSKGGNEAQYVTMTAENNFGIKACYEFDGQGFSKEAIERFMKINGANRYNRQVDKIKAFCGKNDFVHPLGVQLVDPKNMYYLDTTNAHLDIAGYHEMIYMFNTSHPDMLNLKYSIRGEGESVTQGNLSNFAEYLSEHVMEMSLTERKSCCIAIMSIIEQTNAKKGLGYGTGDLQRADLTDMIFLVKNSVPLALDAFYKSARSIYGLCFNLIKDGRDKKDTFQIFGAAAGGLLYTALYSAALPFKPLVIPLRKMQIISNVAEAAVKAVGLDDETISRRIRSSKQEAISVAMQEHLEAIGEKYYGNDFIRRDARRDQNVRFASIQNGIPEIAEIIAPTSYEQMLCIERTYKGLGHKIIDYSIILAELTTRFTEKNLSENYAADIDLQQKALSVAIHRTIEHVRKGESVALVLPEMYDPYIREDVNCEIAKALKDKNGNRNTKYALTAVMVEDINPDKIIQTLNLPPSEALDYRRANAKGRGFMETYYPMIDEFDYVIDENIEQFKEISEIGKEETTVMLQYLKEIDCAFKEVYRKVYGYEDSGLEDRDIDNLDDYDDLEDQDDLYELESSEEYNEEMREEVV